MGPKPVLDEKFCLPWAETAQWEQRVHTRSSQPARASAQLGCKAVEQEVLVWGRGNTLLSERTCRGGNSCATSLWPSAVGSHAHPFALALRCIRATSFLQNAILSLILTCRVACTNLANTPKRIHLNYFSKHPRSIHLWQNNTSAASSHWLLTSMPSSVRNPPSLPCALIAYFTLPYHALDEPTEQMQQLRLQQQTRGSSAPSTVTISGNLPDFQSGMLLPSGSPRAPVGTLSPSRQEVFNPQAWPRSLGDLLVADPEIDPHEGTLGATLREFLQPQVRGSVAALCVTNLLHPTLHQGYLFFDLC